MPAYLGDSSFCRTLLPFPKAVIYLDDFDNDINSLVKLLDHLATNESAYEEYRSSWRWVRSNDASTLFNSNPTKSFAHLSHALHASKHVSELITKSWLCKICERAHRKMETVNSIGTDEKNKTMRGRKQSVP